MTLFYECCKGFQLSNAEMAVMSMHQMQPIGLQILIQASNGCLQSYRAEYMQLPFYWPRTGGFLFLLILVLL